MLHKILFVSDINTKYGFIYYNKYLVQILELCQDLFVDVKFPSNKYKIPTFEYNKQIKINVQKYGIHIVKYRSTLFRCKYNVNFMINKTKLFQVINEKERNFRVLNFQDNQQSKITIYLPIEDYSYDFINILNSDSDLDESKTESTSIEKSSESESNNKKQKKHNIRRHAFEISHDGMINQSSPSRKLGEIACKTMVHLLFKYYDEIKL